VIILALYELPSYLQAVSDLIHISLILIPNPQLARDVSIADRQSRPPGGIVHVAAGYPALAFL
jgi:hypothetical protein